MRVFVNGVYRDMTANELAQMESESRRARLEESSRPLSADEVIAMLILQQINTLTVDDSTALRMLEFYPEWAAGTAYTVGYKVR